jgi:hypothetical protein
MKKKTKVWIVVGVLVLVLNPVSLVVLLIGGAMWSNAHPDTGEDKPRVAWLPPEATSVSYYKTYSWTAFEFDIPEPAFTNWASRWEIREIETPFTIRRYKFFVQKHPDFDPAPDSPYYTFEAEAKATITNGYFYRTPPRGNGGGTYVGYDRDKARAYYQMNPR